VVLVIARLRIEVLRVWVKKLVIGRSTILVCMRLAGDGEEVSPKHGDGGLDLKEFS
jgi:hypothetical protein